MVRRIRAMRKLCRKKLYRMASRVFVIILCVFLCGSTVKKAVKYFFPAEKIAQRELVPLVIPTFDLRIYCKEISASVLSDVKMEVYYRCINLESEAYFAIRDMWDGLSYHVKERCVKMVRPGDGSYFLLRDCFINEKKDEKHKVRNRF
ncbi:hypothetical protein [Bartonella sp. CB178]|uniref:hypothetical protein n=1 Tax=Bartonella sp. CB178 TaxID=3112255 RepID=UPI00300DF26D